LYCVYHIKNKTELKLSRGYIGVTNDIESRWRGHSKAQSRVGKAIRNKNWSIANMTILLEGSEQDCFILESILRPSPHMGLNVAIGGKGGYTSYSKERNLKISKARKGKKFPPEWCSHMSVTMSDGRRKGNKNGRAKKWELISPSGSVTLVSGNLHIICKQFNIARPTLIKHLGRIVEYPNKQGWRPKSEDERQRRLNTIGWQLKCL
jgi:hypothetical protein